MKFAVGNEKVKRAGPIKIQMREGRGEFPEVRTRNGWPRDAAPFLTIESTDAAAVDAGESHFRGTERKEIGKWAGRSIDRPTDRTFYAL